MSQVLTPFRAPVTFTPDSDSITIDFTSKGGPADRGSQGSQGSRCDLGISRWKDGDFQDFLGDFHDF